MLVSILIPCFNAERWVAQAIESALGQTWPEKEIIVIDDGSTDGSLEIVKSFRDSIRWETGPNRGANPARNRLLELARGEWLQYLDADDYLLPDKIERQTEFLSAHPETDIVFGRVMWEDFGERDSRYEMLPIPESHDPWILFSRGFFTQTGALLWRTEAVRDVGGWKPDQPCCQEQELYLRLLMAGKRFAYCPHAGAVYRQWGEHTVCKRDKPEFHRHYLQIVQRAENFLRDRNELTPARLYAINQARFATARSAWQYDPPFATEIMEAVCRLQPDFVPNDNAAPRRYLSIYRLFGFRVAQKAADLRRNLKTRLGRI
jgi:glycosyltransferase involved in cell wall biosynthesis